MKPWERDWSTAATPATGLKPWERRWQAPVSGVPALPSPAVEEPSLGGRVVGQVAAVAEPALEVLAGGSALVGRGLEAIGVPVGPSYLARLEKAAEQAAPAAPAQWSGRLAGEVATYAAPGGMAGRAAQAATAGRGLVGRVAPLAAESTAVGTVAGLEEPEEGRTRLGQAARAAGTQFGLGAAMGGLSRTIAPQMFRTKELANQEETFLRSMGIEPRLPMSLRGEGEGIMGQYLSWAQREPLRAVPVLGKMLRRQTDAALGDWREAILKKGMPQSGWDDIPRPSVLAEAGEQAPVRQTIGAMQDWYRRQYTEVLDPYTFNLATPEMQQGIQKAVSNIAATSARRAVIKRLRKIFGDYVDEYGAVTGSDISRIKANIYETIKNKNTKGDAKAGLHGVLRALDDAVKQRIAGVNPQHAARYGELAEPYRNLQVIEDASTRARAKMGDFVPGDLARAAIGKSRREGSRQAARGGGPLQVEAERAVELYGPALKSSDENIFKALAFGGVMGVGSVGAPGLGLPVAAATLASVNPRVQRYLMSQGPRQQAFQQTTALPASREMARLARTTAARDILE